MAHGDSRWQSIALSIVNIMLFSNLRVSLGAYKGRGSSTFYMHSLTSLIKGVDHT